MNSLTIFALVRNEERRFWPQVLEAWSAFADDIFVLDDASTDNTADIARAFGAEVHEMAEIDPAWGNEWPKRKRLFEAGMSRVEEGSYAMILDADMIPLKDPRPLLEPEPDAVAFNLYDVWDTDSSGRLLYRSDDLWRAHTNVRVWLVKKTKEPEEGWVWRERGLHSGHLPLNLRVRSVLRAPPDHGLLHFGYMNHALRAEKYASYMRELDQLTEEEAAHARSIIDAEPNLEVLPFKPTYTVPVHTDLAPTT